MHMFKFLSKRCQKRHAGAFSLVELMVVIAIIGVLTLVMMPPIARADQQGYPSTINSPTNMPATVAATTTTSGLGGFIPIKAGRGLGLQFTFNVSSGTSSAGLWLAPSVDGTNIETTAIWPWITTAAGTTTLIRTTNWSRGTLDGFAGLYVIAMTNANGGTLTNKGVTFNIPNS
jgi:prepilin-type N-terminal cleavage/methylation domain-containing protein